MIVGMISIPGFSASAPFQNLPGWRFGALDTVTKVGKAYGHLLYHAGLPG